MSSRGFALLFLACFATTCRASDLPQIKGPATVDLIQWLLGVTVVLFALLACAWLLRRLGSFSRLEAGRFEVLAALSLGSRERVILVQAGTKQLVLGVAPGNVRMLCLLDGEDVIRTRDGRDAVGSFSQQLASILPQPKS